MYQPFCRIQQGTGLLDLIVPPAKTRKKCVQEGLGKVKRSINIGRKRKKSIKNKKTLPDFRFKELCQETIKS